MAKENTRTERGGKGSYSRGGGKKESRLRRTQKRGDTTSREKRIFPGKELVKAKKKERKKMHNEKKGHRGGGGRGETAALAREFSNGFQGREASGVRNHDVRRVRGSVGKILSQGQEEGELLLRVQESLLSIQGKILLKGEGTKNNSATRDQGEAFLEWGRKNEDLSTRRVHIPIRPSCKKRLPR